MNGAATAFYFQRNTVYVHAINRFVRMRETVYNLISLSHKPHYMEQLHCLWRAGGRRKTGEKALKDNR